MSKFALAPATLAGFKTVGTVLGALGSAVSIGQSLFGAAPKAGAINIPATPKPKALPSRDDEAIRRSQRRRRAIGRSRTGRQSTFLSDTATQSLGG